MSRGTGLLNGSLRARLPILLYCGACIIEHWALADFVGHPGSRGGVKVNGGHGGLSLGVSYVNFLIMPFDGIIKMSPKCEVGIDKEAVLIMPYDGIIKISPKPESNQ